MMYNSHQLVPVCLIDDGKNPTNSFVGVCQKQEGFMVKVTKFVTPDIIIWCFPQIKYEFVLRKKRPLEISIFKMNGDYIDKLYLRDNDEAINYIKRLDNGELIYTEV